MRYVLPGLVIALLATVAGAQPQVLQAWDFEQGVEGWQTPDARAQLGPTKDAAHVHNGAGSLQFTYPLRAAPEGEMPGVLFAPVEARADLAALHLAVQSNVNSPLLVLLREQDESTYVYLSYVAASDWHVLDLPFSDFWLEDSSKDENGTLDADQLAGMGLVDPAVWLLQASQQGGFPFAVSLPGERTVWLDQVQLLSEAPRKQRAAQGPGGMTALMLEDCDDDAAYFGALGGVNLRLRTDSEQAVTEGSLRADYDLPARTVMALLRPLKAGILQGYQAIVFSARTGADVRLAVSLEEGDKSRYTTLVEVPAGGWQQFTVKIRDLRLEDDSEDPDEGLQLEKVRSISFADANSIIDNKDTANTLWLDEIMAVK